MPGRLKLQYLPIQGRAEGIRMLLMHSNIEFEDTVLEFDVFARAKTSGDLPFGQLPVLLVDDRPIAQTGSILRYIDKLSGANIEDEITAAQADSAFEAAQEMPMAQIYVAVNLMEEPEAKEAARAFKAALPKYLEHWSGNLGARKFFHGKLRNVILIEELGAPCWDVISIDYLLADEALRNVKLAIRRAGQAPGYADFYIWALLDTAKGFVPEAFKDHSSLKQWSARVKGLPAVTKYLSTRPRVRDVSKWKI